MLQSHLWPIAVISAAPSDEETEDVSAATGYRGNAATTANVAPDNDDSSSPDHCNQIADSFMLHDVSTSLSSSAAREDQPHLTADTGYQGSMGTPPSQEDLPLDGDQDTPLTCSSGPHNDSPPPLPPSMRAHIPPAQGLPPLPAPAADIEADEGLDTSAASESAPLMSNNQAPPAYKPPPAPPLTQAVCRINSIDETSALAPTFA